MGVVSEILFCEPTAIGQTGAVLLQLLVWGFIFDYDRGVMAYVNSWVKRQSWYPAVQENYKDDDAQKIYGFPDPGFNQVTFTATVIHHGTGGLLMSLGMLLNQPWLWRHGMLVEVGGMDVLDAVKIAHVKLLPPGTFPTSLFMKAKLFVPMMFFHHSVGLCVGIPVNLYFSEVRAFQMFGLMTLGAPAICLAPSLIIKALDGKTYPRLIFTNKIYLFLTFGLGSRTIYHFPAAYHCFMHVVQSPVGSWKVLVPFTWALLAMSVFNLMILCIQLQGVYEDAKHLLGKSDQPSKTSSSNLSGLVAHLSVESNLTQVFFASKAVGWAKHAKDNVKLKHKSK